MKRNGFRVLTGLIAVVMLGMPVIYAGSEGCVIAEIPFALIVGKTTLPAGQYTVSVLGDSQRVLVVRPESFQAVFELLQLRLIARRQQAGLCYWPAVQCDSYSLQPDLTTFEQHRTAAST